MRRALLGLLLASAAPTAAEVPRPPNIVILVADDWGFTDVGAYGGEISTPNLDALAGAGARFSNFHVAGSCAPTRAMLQTGVSSHRAGLGNMPETIPPAHQGKPGYEAELRPDVVTIADRLRIAGYRTYLTGKWHLGNRPKTLPTARGYDRAFALAASGADNFENKPNLLLYAKANWTEDGKPASLSADFYSSRFIVDKAIEYIGSGDRRKPFLASLNFLANHTPVQAPDADIAAYKDRYTTGWQALRAERRAGAIAAGVMPPGMAMLRASADWTALKPAERAARARAMAAYAGMATAMDREIGRLTAHLKASGDYDNTIFVFLSDNGGEAIDPMAGPINAAATRFYYDMRPDQQGRRGSFTAIGAGWASAVSAPLRGTKFSASEGGLRVPLIIAWPGQPRWRKGVVVPGFAHVVDIAPTLLAVAEAAGGQFAASPPLTGHDLAPLLTGTAAQSRPAGTALGYELAGNAVVWKDDWKLVRNLPPYGDGRWALYDIVADPGETRDRATASPAVVQAMATEYAAFAAREGVLAMPPGYSAPGQIEANAKRDRLWPQLRQLLPWLIAGLGLVVGGFIAARRRARRSLPPG